MITYDIICRKRKNVSVCKFNFFIFKSFNPVFRTFGIQHDRNRKIEFFADFFDQVDLNLMLLMRTVGKMLKTL